MRVEYWQSRADKLKKQNEELSLVAPLAEHLKRNPDLIAAIETQLKKQVAPELEPPVAPKMPDGYSKVDAFSNPESVSWKYREDVEAHREKQIEFLQKKDAQRENMLRQQAEAFQREQAERRAAQQLKTEVQAKHGLTPAEAEELVQLMADPKLTTYHMVQLYKLNKGLKPASQRTSMGPAPIFNIPTGKPGAVDDADMFNAGMLAWKRKK